MRRRKVDGECDDTARIDRRFRKKGQMIRVPAKCDAKRQKSVKRRNYSKDQIWKYSSIFVRYTGGFRRACHHVNTEITTRQRLRLKRMAEERIKNRPQRLLFYQGQAVEHVDQLLAKLKNIDEKDHVTARRITLFKAAQKIETDKIAAERDEKAREIAESLLQEQTPQPDGTVQVSLDAILGLKEEHANEPFVRLVLSHLPYHTLMGLINSFRRRNQEQQGHGLTEKCVVAAEIPEGKEKHARLYVRDETSLRSPSIPVTLPRSAWKVKTRLKQQPPNVMGTRGYDVLTEEVGLETHKQPPSKSMHSRSWTQVNENNEILMLLVSDVLNTSILREEIARKVFWLSLITPEDSEVISKNVNNNSSGHSHNSSSNNNNSDSGHDNWRKSTINPPPPVAAASSSSSSSSFSSPSNGLNKMSNNVPQNVFSSSTSPAHTSSSFASSSPSPSLSSSASSSSSILDSILSPSSASLASDYVLVSASPTTSSFASSVSVHTSSPTITMTSSSNMPTVTTATVSPSLSSLPISPLLASAMSEKIDSPLAPPPLLPSISLPSSSFSLSFTTPELPKNMHSLLVPVFRSLPQFYKRTLNQDEGKHARVTDRITSHEPDDVMIPPKVFTRGPSIVHSMKQFELNFDAFSYGMLRGVNLTRAVISGGAVLACLLPVADYLVDAGNAYYAFREETMQALNVLPNALSQLVDSYARVGHDEWQMHADHFSSMGHPFWRSDIDIFVCAENEHDGLKAIASIASAVAANIPSDVPHCFIRTTNAITVVSSHPYRHVQVILMINRSVEEVLLGADMDCTAVGFTGATGSFLSVGPMPPSATPRQVVCLPRFIRAVNTKHNFLDLAKFSRANMPCRLTKYFERGFSVLLFDICEHATRCDVAVSEEVVRQLLAMQEPRPLYRRRYIPTNTKNYPDMQIPYGHNTEAKDIVHAMSTGHLARREILKQWGQAPHAELLSVDEARKEFKLPWVIADTIEEVVPEFGNAHPVKIVPPTVFTLSEEERQARIAERQNNQYEVHGGRGGYRGGFRGGRGGYSRGDYPSRPEYKRYEVGEEAKDLTVVDDTFSVETKKDSTEEEEEDKNERKKGDREDGQRGESIDGGDRKEDSSREEKMEEKKEGEAKEENEEKKAATEIEMEVEDSNFFNNSIREVEEEERKVREAEINAHKKRFEKIPNPYLTRQGRFVQDEETILSDKSLWERVTAPTQDPTTKMPHKWPAARMCPYEGFTHLPCVRFKKNELIRTGIANEFIPPCYVCLSRFTPQGGMGGVRGALACRLCPDCVRIEEEKISATVDLRGRVGLVTGGRTKIGLAIALKLLRCGALVIVTTRFPQSALLRYKEQPDWNSFKSRLHVYGLDMRALPSVNEFLAHVMRFYPRLDFLINNAAQTVRRPPAYYRGLFDTEQSARLMPPEMKMVSENPFVARLSAESEPAGAVTVHSVAGDLQAFGAAGNANSSQDLAHKLGVPLSYLSAALPLVPLLPSDAPNATDKEVFPVGRTDRDGEPLDLRTATTWTSTIASVPLLEVMETQLVNAIVPFSFISTLTPLLRSNAPLDPLTPRKCNRFVVNVSAREGQFGGKPEKLNIHPHTNMAKASLNMLTRTVAGEMAASKIFVTAVDTGWVSRMRPGQPTLRSVEPPLSNEAGAARVLDPIFSFLDHASPPHGVFLQNYQIADW